MQTDCTNIYQNARKAAGLTQERAAELMGLSARSLADYEAGLRLPPNDVADRMVTPSSWRSSTCATPPGSPVTCCPTSSRWRSPRPR